MATAKTRDRKPTTKGRVKYTQYHIIKIKAGVGSNQLWYKEGRICIGVYNAEDEWWEINDLQGDQFGAPTSVLPGLNSGYLVLKKHAIIIGRFKMKRTT